LKFIYFFTCTCLLISCASNTEKKALNNISLKKKQSDFNRFWSDKKIWDTPYKENISIEEKIAGLSKLWMEAKYNFAFFDQVKDLHWDKSYIIYLSKIKKTKSTREYYKVLRQFYALLKDGHTDIGNPKEIGLFLHARPFIRQRLIEGKVIVTSIDDKSVRVNIGDEIVAINGHDTHLYAKKYIKPYISSSTPNHLDYLSYEIKLLRGQEGKSVKIKFKTRKGKIYTRKLKRHLITNKVIKKLGIQKHTVEDKWIGELAYFKIRHVGNKGVFKTVKKNMTKYKKAKGVILDFRENGGGNTWVGWNILQLFTSKGINGITWKTRKYRPSLRAWKSNEFISNEVAYVDSWTKASKMEKGHDGGVIYDIPIRVLIGRQTFSAGEDTAIAVKSNNLGLLIGENTAGSTGQPLVQSLPGGGWFRVCTKRDYGKNNLDWVGTGVKPDIKVTQNLSDFYSGIDTVLNKAIESFEE
jgi:carboxyl-terminal processing protease